MADAVPHAEDSPRISERRRNVRQPIRSLAYLDIGSDNGGIVVNLSEGGLALHAAVALADDFPLCLRIQLPQSEKRIETTGQIAWKCESKKFAGVRFVDLPEDALVRIKKWIFSEAFPSEFGQKTHAGCEQQEQILPRPSTAKWTSLMVESSTAAASAAKQVEDLPPVTTSAPVRQSDQAAASKPFDDSSSLIGKTTVRAVVPEKEMPDSVPLILPTDAPKVEALIVPIGLQSQISEPASETQLKAPAADVRIGPEPSIVSSIENVRGPDSIEDSTEALPSKQDSPAASSLQSDQQPAPTSTVDIGLEDSLRDLPAEQNSPIAEFLARCGVVFRRKSALGALCGLAAVAVFGLGLAVGLRHGSRSRMNVQAKAAASSAVSPLATTNAAPPDLEKPAPENVRIQGTGGGAVVPLLGQESPRAAGHSSTQSRRTTTESLLPSSSRPINAPRARSQTGPEGTPPLPPDVPDKSVVADWSLPQGWSGNPVPAPPDPARHSSDESDRVVAPYLLYRIEPLYPRAAAERRVEGTVKIHAVIGRDGRIQSVKPVSGPPLLVPAALDAARGWRFIPAFLDGTPIETEQEISIDFRLPR